MATNPMFHTNDSPNRSTQPSKSVNQTSVYVPHSYNTFDMSYPHFKSQKFGQYEPFFVMEGVPGDRIPFSNSHNVRSLPFSAPILSPMTLNKDYFMVPNYAIQPFTWDYIFRNPSQGDDVPKSAQNIFPYFDPEGNSFLEKLLESLSFLVNDYDNTQSDASRILLNLLILEKFLSQGSLLYNLGYKLNVRFAYGDQMNLSFDTLFDRIIAEYDSIYVNFRIDGPDNTFVFRSFIDSEVARQSDDDVLVDRYTIISLIRSHISNIVALESYIPVLLDLSWLNLPAADVMDPSWRMDRVCAYQLACAQYYVNTAVDFIYNAQLFRDNFLANLRDAYNTITTEDLSIAFFQMNGISVQYDAFSLFYYDILVSLISSSASILQSRTDSFLPAVVSVASIVDYLFGFRESLKFGDYFNDSRTQPLAYGEAGSDKVAVFDDGVSVIDMSQKIILQRYRNAVVKVGNNGGDYQRAIFGEELPPDYHIPKFIIHTEFGINGEEISNTTSDNQGNIVTNLKSGEDSFAFDVDVNIPCVILGISHISMPRLYMQTKERPFFHVDRFDFFNPMLQYFGDQEVYAIEHSDQERSLSVFAYNSRNAEYKQRYGQVSGAFAGSLKAWAFVTDAMDDALREIVLTSHLSPESIRAHDFEFNRFLARLNGYSLGEGFHFIIMYNNKCVCNRPMEVNPSTL